ncbi:MAG TPA: MFS transporter [Actinomadura sp.]|jgi:hypothetical protein|nr:MFS transporter [Actinomadura sp.]
MPICSLLRIGRAGVFAAVCVGLAAAGHSAAAGPVAPWAVAAGYLAVAAAALTLAGHERSLATILGGLLGGQFMLHVLFSAMRPAPPGTPPAVHEHLLSNTGGRGGIGMTLAHYAAALLAAWWLRRGERAVWTLARQVAALAARAARDLLVAVRTTPVTGPVRLPVPVTFTPWPVRRVFRHAVLRRGPPIRSRALSPG